MIDRSMYEVRIQQLPLNSRGSSDVQFLLDLVLKGKLTVEEVVLPPCLHENII